MNFKEWMNNTPDVELKNWLNQFQSAIIRSIKPAEGYISLQIASLIKPTLPQAVNLMPSNANLEHSVNEISKPGWKGDAVINSLDNKVNWTNTDKRVFKAGMSAGQNSLPNKVGREMGLLFETKIFLYLVKNFKLKPIGEKNVAYVLTEQSRLIDEINQKAQALAPLAIEFIGIHANEMAEMIYKKTLELITECKVDSIEFTGGSASDYSQNYKKLKGDTADLRVGCSKYLEGTRKDIGYSLKASTETQLEVRSFPPHKAINILMGSKRQQKHIYDTFNTPIMNLEEKKSELMKMLSHLATKNFSDRPKRFARLLELLTTGGADTLPAYRNLARGNGEPGWSGALQKDINTTENPSNKLNPKMGATVEVIVNSTYVALKYMVPGGNHYGTTIKFQPDSYGKSVAVDITGLTSKGGRGY